MKHIKLFLFIGLLAALTKSCPGHDHDHGHKELLGHGHHHDHGHDHDHDHDHGHDHGHDHNHDNSQRVLNVEPNIHKRLVGNLISLCGGCCLMEMVDQWMRPLPFVV